MASTKQHFAFLLVFCLFGIHRSAFADTYTVDTVADDASKTGCSESTSNDCSLRGAVIKANNHSGADIIKLPAGTYTLSIASTDESFAADGDLDIRDDLTIDGANAGTTIVDGGAIDRVFDVSASAPLAVTIDDLTMTNGHSEGSGGGIRVFGDHNVTLNRLIIRDNHTADGGGEVSGGGVEVSGSSSSGATINISRCTISDNTTGKGTDDSIDPEFGGQGGGLSFFKVNGTITNSTITGNKTGKGGNATSNQGAGGGDGGGLYLYNGTLTLNNDTMTDNATGDGGSGTTAGPNGKGGGIFVDPTATMNIRNTILANNRISDTLAPAGFGPDCHGSVTTEGFNILRSSDACTGITNGVLNDHIGVDPKLDPAGLKKNGGPIKTIALLFGSPAINAGDDTTCRPIDERGLARPQGAHCDIGAYEKGTCGDHFLEPEEQCDDGNTTDGDGCSSACVDEVLGTVCGNGVLESDEECDDGNLTDGDGCSSACLTESEETTGGSTSGGSTSSGNTNGSSGGCSLIR